MSTEEDRDVLRAEVNSVIDAYADYGWLDVLSVPEKVLRARHWN